MRAAFHNTVTPGLDPGVHLFERLFLQSLWMAGSSPAMTTFGM
jgi:hypothetical protein